MRDDDAVTVTADTGESQEETVVIDQSMIPTKNPDVTVREEMEEDGRFVLFNAENELILVINATGRYILSSCDGSKTVGRIMDDIKTEFTVAESMDLDAVVKEYMALLVKGKLITMKSDGGN